MRFLLAPLVLLLCLTLGVSAPAPKVKPLKRPDIVGEWKMYWLYGSGDAYFYKNGAYTCLWCGDRYFGSWTLKGDLLSVTESCTPDRPECILQWTVKLEKGKLSGTVEKDRGDFSLKKHNFPK